MILYSRSSGRPGGPWGGDEYTDSDRSQSPVAQNGTAETDDIVFFCMQSEVVTS